MFFIANREAVASAFSHGSTIQGARGLLRWSRLSGSYPFPTSIGEERCALGPDHGRQMLDGFVERDRVRMRPPLSVVDDQPQGCR